ncbi:MAG: metallophosphoesterase [Thermoanaerobaculia bacterium]|nr:metallophosphoesterase [Thermoanaerobaculia bacterium]
MRAVLHVSDLHFGPKHLPELSQAVRELAERERPAVVVVSGDLTQRAKPRQFEAARRWCDSLPVPVAFVPGNHDVPMYRVWERLLAPFGAWRRHFDRALVRDHRGDGLAVVGVTTAFAWTTKHGRLDRAELARLARELAALPAGTARIVVAHHPLAANPLLGDEPVTAGAAPALELCRRHGVELVLSGHLHHGFWLRAPRTGDGEGPLVVHCGTTTSTRGRAGERGRNSLNWIEIDDGLLRIERRFWQARRREFVTEERTEAPRR